VDNSKSKLDTKTSKEEIHGNNVKKDEFSENVSKENSKSWLSRKLFHIYAGAGALLIPALLVCFKKKENHTIPSSLPDSILLGNVDEYFSNIIEKQSDDEFKQTLDTMKNFNNKEKVFEFCNGWLKKARGENSGEGIVSYEHLNDDNFETQKSLILWLLALTRRVIELTSKSGTEDNSELGNNLKLMGFKMLHITQKSVNAYGIEDKLIDIFTKNDIPLFVDFLKLLIRSHLSLYFFHREHIRFYINTNFTTSFMNDFFDKMFPNFLRDIANFIYF
jgi:hypothetical protein